MLPNGPLISWILAFLETSIILTSSIWMQAFGSRDASEEGYSHHQPEMLLTSYTFHADLNYSLCTFVPISYSHFFF